MPRIRTIKPEFWGDEKLAPEPDSVRLLFLALISMADDFGRLLDSPKQIEAFAWPHGSRLRQVQRDLDRLAALKRIERGATSSGQQVIQLANWSRHQKVDHPNKGGAFPEILATDSRLPRDGFANESRGIRDSISTSTSISTTTSTDEDERANGGAVASPPPVEYEFVNSSHRAAYLQFRRESKRTDSLDRSLRDMVEARTGTWAEIGAALADMAGNGMPFGASLLRGCIKKLHAERDGGTGGAAKNGPALLGRNRANIRAGVESVLSHAKHGGPAK